MKNSQTYRTMEKAKARTPAAEVLRNLEAGLSPILDNLKPGELSPADKAEILAELQKLEQLALKIKRELSMPKAARF